MIMRLTSEGRAIAKKIIVVLFIVALFFLGLLFSKGCQVKDLQKQFTIQALSSHLKKSIDKNGLETVQKELIMLDYKTLKSIHASDSSEIGRLQKLLTKNTISATIIKTATTGTLSGHTHVVIKDYEPKEYGFTVTPCDTLYPEYTDTLKDKWSNITITANKDTTMAIYNFNNELEFTQQYQKQGKWPFRKEVPIVMVKNLNPHTTTTGISSYAVPVPDHKNKFALGTGAALLIGLAAGIFIAK